jgi:hypothetical protein
MATRRPPRHTPEYARDVGQEPRCTHPTGKLGMEEPPPPRWLPPGGEHAGKGKIGHPTGHKPAPPKR